MLGRWNLLQNIFLAPDQTDNAGGRCVGALHLIIAERLVCNTDVLRPCPEIQSVVALPPCRKQSIKGLVVIRHQKMTTKPKRICSPFN